MDTVHQAVLRDHLVERRRKLEQTIDRARDSARLVELLQQVDAALGRMEEGSYGICEVCRQPIEDDYLRADPLVRVCLSHLTEEQQRAIERDLESASTIQGKLLPSASMRLPGWEIVHHYEPLGIVSGDFCDVIRTDGPAGETFFLFGDVSGKGVAHDLGRWLSEPALKNHLLQRAQTVRLAGQRAQSRQRW